MSSPWYTPSGTPATSSSGSSALMRTELGLIETALDQLPAFSGNASKIIAVNSGATAYEATSTLTGITLTANIVTVDNLVIDGNTISSSSGDVNITPVAGSAIVLDATINIDAGVVTGATSITSTTFVGALTGNADTATTAGTVTTAAQPSITSVGTLTTLTVDNLTINENTITADSGALNLTPAGGSAIVLDGTINVDAGVVTGATSITSTTFVGDLTGNASGTAATVTTAAQPAITSVGTLTSLSVGAITSTADMTIYDDQNNADTSFSIGTSATERLLIQVLNGAANKTAESINIVSQTASGTANHGQITFGVDDATILTIDDSGINAIIGATTAAAITGTTITGTSFVIGANTLTTTEWAFLDGQNQTVATTSDPTFGDLTITSFAANWTNAGRTVADLGAITTVDINGGTVGGVTLDGTISGTPTWASTQSLNTSGTAATVTGAAQAAITSLGTLTTLTVDNLTINGNTITADSGALNLTPAGGSAIVLDGTINVDAGVITGATSITSTAFVGDLTGNASGTAATVTTAAQPNITSVGTLTSLTSSGVITGLTIEATGDTSAGDNAAMGYTATEGLILTGQGSTNDVTIKNDADVVVARITTGSTTLTLAGILNMVDGIILDAVLQNYVEQTNDIGSTGGGTQDIDVNLGNSVLATVDTSANTFTFSGAPATDEFCGFTLTLKNGASQTVNWPGSVDWEGGTAPTLTAAGTDILAFYTVDSGTIWHGKIVSTDSK